MRVTRTLTLLAISIVLGGCFEDDASGIYSYEEKAVTWQCQYGARINLQFSTAMLISFSEPDSIELSILDNRAFPSSYNPDAFFTDYFNVITTDIPSEYPEATASTEIVVANIRKQGNLTFAEFSLNADIIYQPPFGDTYDYDYSVLLVPAAELLTPEENTEIMNIAINDLNISEEELTAVQAQGADGYWLGNINGRVYDLALSGWCTGTTTFTGVRTWNPWSS